MAACHLMFPFGLRSWGQSFHTPREQSFHTPLAGKFPYLSWANVSILYRRRFFAVQRRTPQLGFQCRPAPDANRL